MGVEGIFGGFSWLSGQMARSGQTFAGCRSVYEADPGAVIRKEEDGIVKKSNYTEEDALWNQYMKQYRNSMRIVDGKLVVSGDPRPALLGNVSREEMELFRQKVEQEGIGDEIDWQGVEADFKHMEIGFENAGYLNKKIDYIASRYAVLKDRIESTYDGKEQEEQIHKLNQVMDSAKKTILDSYTDSVGEFYEKYAGSGTKKELADSLSKGIDSRITMYEEHLKNSESYGALESTTARWLKQDDGYMAARLREDMEGKDLESHGSAAGENADGGLEGNYSLHDLKTAGVYAAECRSRLEEQGAFWSDNEERIGLDLAVQGMKTEYLAEHGKLNGSMQKLLMKAFDNYKKEYTDLLEQMLKEKAKGFNTPMKTNVDRNRTESVYDYTMAQYRQSRDMMDAFTKGAKEAQAQFERNFSSESGKPGNYSARYDWNRFFGESQYANSKIDDSAYGKYEKSISRFLQSMEPGSEGGIHLLFGSSGDYELNLFI